MCSSKVLLMLHFLQTGAFQSSLISPQTNTTEQYITIQPCKGFVATRSQNVFFCIFLACLYFYGMQAFG